MPRGVYLKKLMPREIRICPTCTKEFKVIVTAKKKFCCKSCYGKSYKGKSYEERYGIEKAIKEKQKRSIALLGKIVSKETRKKQREIRTGKKNSEQSKIKNSIAQKRLWEDVIYRENQIKSQTLAQNRPEVIQRSISSHTGQKRTAETKRKMRLKAIERIERDKGKCFCNYNKDACEIFKKFDAQSKTKGRYAVYGDGEFRIHKLGYTLDYINFDLKLIIEVYEKRHFRSEKIILKDLQRQKEIQEFYSEFKFLIFKEEEMLNILNTKVKELA